MKIALINIAITVIGIGLLMTGNLGIMILGGIALVMIFGNIGE